MNYKVYKWVYLALSILSTIMLTITFFVETRWMTQCTFLVMAVGYGFVGGMAFMGDMD